MVIFDEFESVFKIDMIIKITRTILTRLIKYKNLRTCFGKCTTSISDHVRVHTNKCTKVPLSHMMRQNGYYCHTRTSFSILCKSNIIGKITLRLDIFT